jgi:hypothetical protein
MAFRAKVEDGVATPHPSGIVASANRQRGMVFIEGNLVDGREV